MYNLINIMLIWKKTVKKTSNVPTVNYIVYCESLQIRKLYVLYFFGHVWVDQKQQNKAEQ